MRTRPRPGFTLIELLVVITIIALVSAATLPAVLPAIQHRQISESARLVQATIEGARDAAIRANEPRGVRLMIDPAFPGSTSDATVPLAYSRMISLEPAPDYSEGLVSVFLDPHPSGTLAPYPGTTNPYPAGALRVEESRMTTVSTPTGDVLQPNARTSWYWNVRVGDRIRIGKSGALCTVVGPVKDDNPERFVNIGPPGTVNPWSRTYATSSMSTTLDVEFLYVVNGRDDDGDGYADEGFDGLDNDGGGATDEVAEWEGESWPGVEMASPPRNQAYSIRRRPAPAPGSRVVSLPSGVVIDATTWGTTRERSRLPVDPATLAVDLMVLPNGQVVPGSVYSTPAAAGVSPFLHLWIAERGDVHPAAATGAARLPMPDGVIAAAPASLKGDRRMVTVNMRSGNVTTSEVETFDAADVEVPFHAGRMGIREAR